MGETLFMEIIRKSDTVPYLGHFQRFKVLRSTVNICVTEFANHFFPLNWLTLLRSIKGDIIDFGNTVSICELEG